MGFGDAVDEEILVLAITVFAHDAAELRQRAVQNAHDRVALEGNDLAQPVGEERNVGRERQGRARDIVRGPSASQPGKEPRPRDVYSWRRPSSSNT